MTAVVRAAKQVASLEGVSLQPERTLWRLGYHANPLDFPPLELFYRELQRPIGLAIDPSAL